MDPGITLLIITPVSSLESFNISANDRTGSIKPRSKEPLPVLNSLRVRKLSIRACIDYFEDVKE